LCVRSIRPDPTRLGPSRHHFGTTDTDENARRDAGFRSESGWTRDQTARRTERTLGCVNGHNYTRGNRTGVRPNRRAPRAVVTGRGAWRSTE
jgi:hypothetical protein